MQAHLVLVVIITSYFCCSADYDINEFFLAEKSVTKNCATKPPLVLLPVIIKVFRYPQVSSGYIAIALKLLLESASCSIAGLTYMDALDFEERYRDVHECDPFYWHPLHLPEDCADIYERLIRSRLSAAHSVRVLKHRQDPLIQYTSPHHDISYHFEYPTIPVPSLYPSIIQIPEFEPERRHLSPYEKMLESVRKDVKNQPSFPSVQILPYFGAVTLYHQPVSTKSAMMITHLSRTYAGAARDAPTEYEIVHPNEDDQKKEKMKKMGKMVQQALHRGFKKKSVKGNIVTLAKNRHKS